MSKYRKYLDKMEYPHPHLGNMIEKIIRKKRISQAEVARKMNVSPSTMANYLRQPSIQFGILWKLCIALEYDFLSELKTYYPPKIQSKNNTAEQEKIQELEKEIAIYKTALRINDK